MLIEMKELEAHLIICFKLYRKQMIVVNDLYFGT